MKKCPKCGREYEDANTLCPSDGTVLQKDGDELLGQTLIGKYRIEEKINEGGMGAVYRATHVLMEKTVAIKVLHPALAADDKIVARFTREAKAASRLTHPHAITVTDFGEADGGVVFLVMEYLRGRTLKHVVRQDGPMPLARAAEIIRQVCGALDAAHEEGVVHRDLKSDNIMLEESHGGGDWAKVLDFGIAKIIQPEGGTDPELTAPNLIIGTPQYMSPEQCSQASEIDSRSDIYSVGVILFEMLAGHVPFTGDSPTGIMMKHIQEPPPSLLEERDDLPASVARVVERALAKRPEDRFQTAHELAEALAQASLDESASAATAAGVAAAHTDGQTASGTSRIVVTTGENEPPRSTTNEDYDEATVVTARRGPRADTGEVMRGPAPPPPPAPGFNPWKIALPAIAALVLVFGAFYAFRGNESSAEDGTPPLTSDPNSQPVETAPPATGEAERNLTPSSNSALPPSDALGGGTTTTTTNSNTNSNASVAATPEGEDAPADENPDEGEEEEEVAPTPKPTPTPRKAPTPPFADTDDDAPPIRPRSTDTPAPRPSPPSPTTDNDDVPAPKLPSP